MKNIGVGTKEQLATLLGVAAIDIDQAISNRSRHYRIHTQKKSDGTPRTLHVPQGPLKLLQQKVKQNIFDSIQFPACVQGGVIGRSVVTNARPHVGREIVFSLDVKDFFPSVSPQIVLSVFQALGFGPEATEILVDITTWNQQLPQGAPTSSGVANLAMARVDARLRGLAQKQGFAYTRYVDDLTLSGSKRLLDFRPLIKRIVEAGCFKIKSEKVRTMHAGDRQIVTGIIVNEKPNLPREERRLIRRQVMDFSSSPATRRAMIDTIRGKLSWFAFVNPKLGSRLRMRVALTRRLSTISKND